MCGGSNPRLQEMRRDAMMQDKARIDKEWEGGKKQDAERMTDRWMADPPMMPAAPGADKPEFYKEKPSGSILSIMRSKKEDDERE